MRLLCLASSKPFIYRIMVIVGNKMIRLIAIVVYAHYPTNILIIRTPRRGSTYAINRLGFICSPAIVNNNGRYTVRLSILQRTALKTGCCKYYSFMGTSITDFSIKEYNHVSLHRVLVILAFDENDY